VLAASRRTTASRAGTTGGLSSASLTGIAASRSGATTGGDSRASADAARALHRASAAANPYHAAGTLRTAGIATAGGERQRRRENANRHACRYEGSLRAQTLAGRSSSDRYATRGHVHWGDDLAPPENPPLDTAENAWERDLAHSVSIKLVAGA
jgi:hypothetical protein